MIQFQSTLPVGGATPHHPLYNNFISISIHAPRGGSDNSIGFWSRCVKISIHAPRGGSDGGVAIWPVGHLYFNPRSPWGERLTSGTIRQTFTGFQSTLPVGGATRGGCPHLLQFYISIHAPRGGSDSAAVSCRVRSLQISIHAPRGGSDEGIPKKGADR